MKQANPHALSTPLGGGAYPFVAGSFWLSGAIEREAALGSVERCDVAIVGGGYTGLCAALRLKELGVDVAILEADFCGSGASGRNAGHVTPTIGRDMPTCIRMFGREKGLALVHLAEEAVELFEATLKKREIDCDYDRTGNIIAGVHNRQRSPLKESAELAESLGIKMTFLDEAMMAEKGMPPAFRFGVLEGTGGTINPGKYVLGLRAAAKSAGVRVYEGSRVTRIANGQVVTLHTDQGQLKATQVLLAANAYTPSEFGLLSSKTAAIRTSQFVTRPLTTTERESLGWYGREGIYTAHDIIENYRFTADGRLLGGSKDFVYAAGKTLAPGYQQRSFDLMVNAFRERFPTLAKVPIETVWGGWIAITIDFLPIHGRFGSNRNVYYYSGCNGHGIPQCTLMGAALADCMAGLPSPSLDLLDRFLFPLPPEPLRSAVIKFMKAKMNRVDDRVDTAVRAGDFG